MEYNFLPVLTNPLLQSKIFSYLEASNLEKVRFVCSNFAEAGEYFFSKRNRYFVLNSSTFPNRKSVREFNNFKIDWVKDCINGGSKFWLLQRVEFPIREVLQCKKIRDLIVEHGYLFKSLRHVKHEAFMERLLGISEDCSSPLHLLHLILTTWCPNLTSLSIIETFKTNINYYVGEHIFPQFELPHPVFKEKLKLESLTIDYQVGTRYYKNSFPISFYKELFRSSPNLKHLKTVWADDNFSSWPEKDYATDELFFTEDEDYGLVNLEILELPFPNYVNASFLQRLTPEKFPRLKSLDIGLLGPNKFENYEGLLNHSGVKSVTIRIGISISGYLFDRSSEFLDLGLLFKMAPYVSSICTFEKFAYDLGFPEISCKILPDTYDNIRKLELDTRKWNSILEFVHILGTACPNLELFKMKRIAMERKEEEVKINSTFQEITVWMKNLRHFELAYYGPRWVDEEWEELRTNLNAQRGLRFYFGSQDYLKTRTRFDCENLDLNVI